MANKKQTPSEDWFFLPQRVQESTKLDITEKNVVATLCFYRMNYSIYAKEHDRWFYVSLNEIAEGASMSSAQLKRVLIKLITKKVIERKSGTNHRCTHYRLHSKIDELLPIVEANEPLAITEEVKTHNEPLVEKTSKIEANEPLDKIREDKKRQDKSFLITSITNSIENNNNVVESGKTKEDFSIQQQFDYKVFYVTWCEKFKNCKTQEEIETVFKQELKTEVQKYKEQLDSNKGRTYLEALKDQYDKLWLHLHYKKSK